MNILTKETVNLKQINTCYDEYNSTSGLNINDYQIIGVKTTYDNGDMRLFVITNFSSLSIQDKLAKINILELYKNSNYAWEVLVNPLNKLFDNSQMIISKDYYIDTTTDLPTTDIYNNDGSLKTTVINNWDYYYNIILNPYILQPLANTIKFYIG